MIRPIFGAVLAFLLTASTPLVARLDRGEVHVWETQEITLQAARDYANPYVDVVCWIDLEGPGFSRRVHGFWDGGRTFRVRFVATTPGEWRWRSHSNQPDDAGLNGGTGALRAVAWSPAELGENINRRGFIRATANGHALEHADGTPFFLLGDTWLAALDRTINIIALAGLSFAVGLVVDDAIVALENIDRHMKELGKPPRQAALEGVTEVWAAILSVTLVRVAVFIPIVLNTTEAGLLFKDIAIAIVTSVLVSLLVTLTVVPSFAALLLRGESSRMRLAERNPKLHRLLSALAHPEQNQDRAPKHHHVQRHDLCRHRQVRREGPGRHISHQLADVP